MREKTPRPGAQWRPQVWRRADGKELRAPAPFAYTGDGELIHPGKKGVPVIVLGFPFYLDRIEGCIHALVFQRWRPHEGWVAVAVPPESLWKSFGWWLGRGICVCDQRLFREFALASISEELRKPPPGTCAPDEASGR